MELSRKEIEYLRCANRSCGFSYRSSCRRSGGVGTAKQLRDKGLLYLKDKGEKCNQGRFIWRTTDAGAAALNEPAKIQGDGVIYQPYERPKPPTIPERRFWWIIKLCRMLLKFCGDQNFDETWERRVERKDGKIEYEFFIRVILNKPKEANE